MNEMNTKLKVYQGGGFECVSNTCLLRKRCAQHETAGDYRNEGGFTPVIKSFSIFLGGADAYCESGAAAKTNNDSYGNLHFKFEQDTLVLAHVEYGYGDE